MSFGKDMSPALRDRWIDHLIQAQERSTSMVRAKFRCTSIQAPDWKGEGRQVHLSAVYGPDGSANASWAKATPSGELTMYVTNPAAYDAFEEGKEYYLDFTPASE